MTYIAKGLFHNFIYFLHSFDLDPLLQDSDSIYLLLQRKCTPRLRKTWIDITYRNFRPFTRG